MLSFLFFLWVAGCTPIAGKSKAADLAVMHPKATVGIEKKEPSAWDADNLLTEEKLKNGEYYSSFFQKSVQLSEGKFSIEENAENGSVTLLPQMAIGDLNGDQAEDAAVLLAEDGGGSGVFVTLVVMLNDNGRLKQSGDSVIDDRPRINFVSIENGEVLLDAVIHGINDPMAAPSFHIRQTYRLLEDRLFLMELSSSINGSREQSIKIDTPIEGQSVSGLVSILGSMPVSPFENNLRFAVYDLAGNLYAESGFMVDAVDIGAPAVFNNTVELPILPSGSMVRIELADLSMADGSLIAMDSVIVNIK